MLRGKLAAAAALIALGLAACGPAESPEPTVAPTPSDQTTLTPSPTPTPSLPTATWPAPDPARGSVDCTALADRLRDDIAALAGVNSVTEVRLAASACVDAEPSREVRDGYALVALAVDGVDGPALAELNDSLHELLVAEVAPLFPYALETRLVFPNGSRFETSRGSLALPVDLAGAITAAAAGTHPVEVLVQFPFAGGPQPVQREDLESSTTRVWIDGSLLADQAAVTQALNAARDQLVTIPAAQSELTIEIGVPALLENPNPYGLGHLLPIHVDAPGSTIDPLWAEAAFEWLLLVAGDNPYGFDASALANGTISRLAGPLPNDKANELDRFLDVLEKLGYAGVQVEER